MRWKASSVISRNAKLKLFKRKHHAGELYMWGMKLTKEKNGKNIEVINATTIFLEETGII